MAQEMVEKRYVYMYIYVVVRDLPLCWQGFLGRNVGGRRAWQRSGRKGVCGG